MWTYIYTKDRLAGVVITFKGYDTFLSLFSTLNSSYGRPTWGSTKKLQTMWEGQKTDVGLFYDDLNREGFIAYIYKPLKSMHEERTGVSDDL